MNRYLKGFLWLLNGAAVAVIILFMFVLWLDPDCSGGCVGLTPIDYGKMPRVPNSVSAPVAKPIETPTTTAQSPRVGPDDLYPPPGVTGSLDPYTSTHVQETICNKSWSTKSIRPSVSYTNKIKAQRLSEWNKTWGTNYAMKDGELDHLCSLEIGGNPTSTDNLWFEPGPIPNPKDKVENWLHDQICLGKTTPQQACQAISADWVKIQQTAGI